jgi:hypothetical protein
MTLFDLLFIVAFLSFVIALSVALVQAFQRKRERALAVLRRTAAAVTAYFAVIMVVSVATPRQVVPRGVAQCFDDWCITVQGTSVPRPAAGDSVRVVLQLSSLARGITQGERDVRVYLIDAEHRRYAPVAEAGAVALSAQISPGGTLTTSRVFLLSAGTRAAALIVVHDWFPHCCIIADRESLLHRAAIVPLD